MIVKLERQQGLYFREGVKPGALCGSALALLTGRSLGDSIKVRATRTRHGGAVRVYFQRSGRGVLKVWGYGDRTGPEIGRQDVFSTSMGKFILGEFPEMNDDEVHVLWISIEEIVT